MSHHSSHIFSVLPKDPHIGIRNPLVNSAGVSSKKRIHEFINLLVPSIYLKSYGQHAEKQYMEQIILKNNAISITGKLLFPSGGELFRLYRYGPTAYCCWQGNHVLLGFHIAFNVFQCLRLQLIMSKRAYVINVKVLIKMDKRNLFHR